MIDQQIPSSNFYKQVTEFEIHKSIIVYKKIM